MSLTRASSQATDQAGCRDGERQGGAKISDGACKGGGSIRQDPWAPTLGGNWMAGGACHNRTGLARGGLKPDLGHLYLTNILSINMQCASLCPESLIYNKEGKKKKKTKRHGLTAAVELR